jgi:hypothetical protein
MTCFIPLNEKPALHPSLRFCVREGQAFAGRQDGHAREDSPRLFLKPFLAHYE